MAKRNQTKASYYPLGGGLDVVTPALTVDPGRALAMVNFEPWFNGGYRRVDGFERLDGRPKPHLQVFVGFELDTIAGLVKGTTVLTGDASGATGLVVDFDAATLSVAVTKTTGLPFTNGEAFNAGTYTMSGVALQGGAPTETLTQQYQLATEDEYRDDILVVPGDVNNPVRG